MKSYRKRGKGPGQAKAARAEKSAGYSEDVGNFMRRAPIMRDADGDNDRMEAVDRQITKWYGCEGKERPEPQEPKGVPNLKDWRR